MKIEGNVIELYGNADLQPTHAVIVPTREIRGPLP